MKLNLGCGDVRMEGFLNVDKIAACNPDKVVDLENFPWPFEDNSAEYVLLNHVLEHLGRDSAVFIKIIQELYRISKPDARIEINVPHPRHNFYLGDPTHVRPITAELFFLFSKRQCLAWREIGASNTPLALYYDVDFELVEVETTLDEPWAGRLRDGKITEKEVDEALRQYNNVASEIRLLMRPVK